MDRGEVKILLVDDSVTMLRAVSNSLVKFCEIPLQNIFTAENGEEGLKVFDTVTPHLIISDWNMPIMNGLEFVGKVREKDSKVTIIMLTTEGERSRVVQALKTGVNDYMVKPFTPEIVTKKINIAIDMVARRYT
ncbi:MAG: hypothetical protein RL154_1417 [Pseudomonadota bacterium]|jgi:two-component system chemotaxis response regulator CheY